MCKKNATLSVVKIVCPFCQKCGDEDVCEYKACDKCLEKVKEDEGAIEKTLHIKAIGCIGRI